MAMNKKEQAEMDELRNQLRLARAFRRTAPVLPDVPPPSGSPYQTTGFLYGGYAGVTEAWSTPVSHGYGQPSGASRMCGSQNGVHLFSTKELALRARRWDMEVEFEKKLADIDLLIEIEVNKNDA